MESLLPLDVRAVIRAWRGAPPEARLVPVLTWSTGSSAGLAVRLHAPEPWIELCYTVDGQSSRPRFELLSTRPHYGGCRWWICCPCCSARVAVVYLGALGSRWGCRACSGAVYRVTREHREARLMRKARKVRDRLPGASADMFEPYLPERPRGMWERTYWRRVTKARAASDAATGFILDNARRALDRLERLVATAGLSPRSPA